MWGQLPFSKKPTTGPHPNKDQINQHPHTTFPYYRYDFYHFIFSYQHFPNAILDKYFSHFILYFHIICHAILTVPAVRKRQRLKCNIHPRAGHESPEGDLRYSSTLSLTSALCVGGWSMPHSGRFTPPWERDWLPTVHEFGWVPKPV